MSIQSSYYLLLNENIFQAVRFLSITPKLDGIEPGANQKYDKDGAPIWTINALVKVENGPLESEVFTLPATKKIADDIAALPEFTSIRLLGLQGGKWSRADSDKTKWTFLITGIKVAS